MKKTKLGKITFLLVCLLTFTFVFVKAYTIWNACDILYVILGFSCICAAVYMVIYLKNNFGDILHIIESEKGVTVFALCGEYYVLPVLKLLASILIMGYIVVPSKYIEYAEE